MTKQEYMDALENGDALQHHGILGMKWGIRRFQNEDGTLTPQGKKRYLTTFTDVTDRGDPKITALGDADRRRMDLEKQNKRDAVKALWNNSAYRIGNYIAAGGGATAASLGTIGIMGLTNPVVAAASAAGAAIAGGIGHNVGKRVAEKQTGLDDRASWDLRNMNRYNLDTGNLGFDVRWLDRSSLARYKNQMHQRSQIDALWKDQ